MPSKITFLTFKHSNGRPFVLTIKAASSDLECPVILLTQYLAIRGSAPGFLFCFNEAVPVKRAQFNIQLKHALQFCSYNTDRYKSISLQIGASKRLSSL